MCFTTVRSSPIGPEVAQVTAYNGASLIGTGMLQVDASDNTLASFAGTGFGMVSNLSPATQAGGGGWMVSNPFGDAPVSKLEFTALTSSLCGTGTMLHEPVPTTR